MNFHDKVIESLVCENLSKGFDSSITKDCYFYLAQTHSLLFSIITKVNQNKYWSGKGFLNNLFNENPNLLDNYEFLNKLFFTVNPENSDILTEILVCNKILMPKIFEDPKFIDLVYQNDEFIGFLTTKKFYKEVKTENFLHQLMNHPRIHLDWIPENFRNEHIKTSEQVQELIKKNVLNYQYIPEIFKSQEDIIVAMVDSMMNEKNEIIIIENIKNIPDNAINDEMAIKLSKNFSKYIYNKLSDKQKQNPIIFRNAVTEQIKQGNYQFLDDIDAICFKNDHNIISFLDAFLHYKPNQSYQSSNNMPMKLASTSLYGCMKKIRKYNKDVYAIHQQNDYEDYAIGKKENLKNLLHSTFKKFWHEGSFDQFAHTVKAKILENILNESTPLEDSDKKKFKI